ncbi:hypothetical protein CYLTODRAFT_409171 [Cylindrobasidium torrendii FP15055 ss-10]|uniref:Protein kinase domain-containing protein n=1 Tax=Cylindrobasidium torrendii FP15055 ss-10 TaxID=1314674 RepID=A0A0D7BK83_9AGAR|nr:hypothetical protein CYLTODRAFT_409171 [Cylindrobasidium torrendii FP15055 ss-10]
MAELASTPLISKISRHRPTYFDIFSRASKLGLVDLKWSSPLLAKLSKPQVILEELCQWNGKANVYYGKLESGGADAIDIAVKIGDHDEITDEALQYRDMHSLWGKTIPICHGLYSLAAAGKQLGVLVLERFGSTIDCRLSSLSRMEKTTLLNHVLEIHSLGKILNDLQPRNWGLALD